MSNYIYIFGGELLNIHFFNHLPFFDDIGENLFVDEMPEDKKSEKRPQLDALIDKISEKDVLYIHSLDQLGLTMSELIWTLESLSIINIKLVIIDKSEQAFMKSLGSLKAATKKFKSFNLLQSKVAKNKINIGIQIAKKHDEGLPERDKSKKIYKGKQSKDVKIKLSVVGLVMQNERPTQIAKNKGVSKASIYRYIKEINKNYPLEVLIFSKLNEIKGFEVRSITTYNILPHLILDVFFHLLGIKQKKIIEAEYNYKNNYSIPTNLKEFKIWIENNNPFELVLEPDINATSEELEPVINYTLSVIELFVNHNIKNTSALFLRVGDVGDSTLKDDLSRLPIFGEKGLSRILALTDHDDVYLENGTNKVLRKLNNEGFNNDFPLTNLRHLMNAHSNAGSLLDVRHTLCHYGDCL